MIHIEEGREVGANSITAGLAMVEHVLLPLRKNVETELQTLHPIGAQYLFIFQQATATDKTTPCVIGSVKLVMYFELHTSMILKSCNGL